jgi:hypothetical protein
MSHNRDVFDSKLAAGRQSQDARRHQEDARHNERHKTPPPGVLEDENTVHQQREIPKVGSRDAPGG